VEILEEAGGHGPAAVRNQKVSVASGGEAVRKDGEDAVGAVGLEDVADDDRVGPARPAGHDPTLGQPADGVLEPDLDAGRERLRLELLIERPRLAPPPDEIEHRRRRAAGVLASFRVVEGGLAERLAAKRRIDPRGSQLVEDVASSRPVFDALQVTVKTASHILPLFVDDGVPTGACDSQSRRQPRRPRSDDVDHLPGGVGHRQRPS